MLALVVFLPALIALLTWRRQIPDLRDRLLIASIAWGTAVIASTELLSRFNHISRPWIFAVWCAAGPLAAAATSLVPKISRNEQMPSARPDCLHRAMFASIAIILVMCGLASWIGPPNNWDSMTYHMTRVVHWIQNGNVSFYPARNPSQLELPPGAEYIILHLQLLFDGDRLANMVQWLAFVGCMVAVSNIARDLGGDARTQALAALLTATQPSACLESATTQGDLVSSFWLLCFIWLILRIRLD